MKKIIFIIFLLTFILAVRFFFFFHNQEAFSDGEEVTIQTTLFSAPKIVSNQQRFRVATGSTHINIRTKAYPKFSYGDSLDISGKIRGQEIDGKKILFLLYPKIEKQSSKNVFLGFFSGFRQSVVSLFEKSLPGNSASLLLGIVFGIKEGFSTQFYGALSKTGVLHVVAASGMNVTIIAGFLFGMFQKLFRRQVALCVSAVGIICYAAISGFEPSIVRASIMGILVFGAQLFGRQILSYYLLCLTAFVMLFVNPYLYEDVGFQLSFFATSGILFLKPILSQIFSRVPFLLVREDFETTLASQIATLPILVLNFHTLSVFSILVNVLVLWTVPLLMIIGGIASLSGFIFAPLATLLLWLAYPLLWYFETVISIFARYSPDIQIEVSDQSALFFGLSYYLFLIGFLVLLKKKHAK